jgi:hypothetical protein
MREFIETSTGESSSTSNTIMPEATTTAMPPAEPKKPDPFFAVSSIVADEPQILRHADKETIVSITF